MLSPPPSVLRFFLAWFRYMGLAMGVLSIVAMIVFAYSAFRSGHVIVNGAPRTEGIWPYILLPLPTAVIGLALFFFVPKLQDKPARESRPTR